MNAENESSRLRAPASDENRKIPNIFSRTRNPGHWARFPNSEPTELRTHDKFAIRNVYKLNFGKDSTTNQTKPTQSTAKRVQSCDGDARRARRCARAGWARRAGCRCADCLRCNALRAGWLHSRGAGGTMLLTEGFLGWLSRFKLIRLRRISLATFADG